MITSSTSKPMSVSTELIETFHRDGLAIVPGLLSKDECVALCELTDRLALNSDLIARGHVDPFCNTMVLRHIQSLDQAFMDLTIREPFYGYAQAIVGSHPKLCGMNVIRNRTDQAISHWHTDDSLEIPLAPGQVRHDPGMRMPIMWFTIQIALTNTKSYEQGPTEIVPGSHYSGRGADKDNPRFEGRGPMAAFCNAGDAYLFNHQVWHRGAPNTSPDTRYLMQIQYCQAWIHNRFSDRRNVLPPPGAPPENPKLRDLLGIPT